RRCRETRGQEIGIRMSQGTSRVGLLACPLGVNTFARKGQARRPTLLLCFVLASSVAFAQTPPARIENSTRFHDLLRSGNLYLSLQDALALAIENNLDIELQRYNLPIANFELQRTRGGGTARGLNYAIFEAPTGTGGPLSAVPTNAAVAGRATTGTSIGTNALGLN